MKQKRTRKTLSFNRSDIAKAAGVVLTSVYKAVERKQLDPFSMRSIADYIHAPALKELEQFRQGIIPRKYKQVIKKIELKVEKP